MPILTPAAPTPAVAASRQGGMTWAQIKEQALKRTDRRAEKQLDMDYELLAVIQDFCSEAQWYWRKLTASFTTTAGISTYDLSDANGADALDCEKIIRAYVVKSATDQKIVYPIVDENTILTAQEDTGTGEPVGIMREPGSTNTIRLAPIPNAAYKMRILFWAAPSIAPDAAPETVPLVPGRYHHILVKMLERSVLRYTIGEGAVKYQAVSAECDRLISKAVENKQGFAGISREYTSSEPSIRSTK